LRFSHDISGLRLRCREWEKSWSRRALSHECGCSGEGKEVARSR
jgi:hypothetical protein